MMAKLDKHCTTGLPRMAKMKRIPEYIKYASLAGLFVNIYKCIYSDFMQSQLSQVNECNSYPYAC